jgi:hypothetical protein
MINEISIFLYLRFVDYHKRTAVPSETHRQSVTDKRERDGSSAAQRFDIGKGSFYLLGFSAGYSYYTFNEKPLVDFIEKILSSAGVEKNKLSDTLGGVYEKRLQNGKYEIVYLFNNTDEEKCFDLERPIVALSDRGAVKDGKACVPAGSMAYFVIE